MSLVFRTTIFILFPLWVAAQDSIPKEYCQQFIKDIQVSCIQADDADMLWVGTNKGLFLFNSFDGVRTIHEEGAVTAIALDYNYAWNALSSGKVMTLDRKKSFQLELGVQVSSMKVKDRELWIGTRKKGVYVYDAHTLEMKSHYHKGNSKLKSDEVNFIHLDQSNALWIGTAMGVCHVMNNIWKLHKQYDRATAITEKEDELWLMTRRDLWVIKEGEWNRKVLRNGAFKGRVNGMYFDKNKRLYFASDILTRYNLRSKALKKYDVKEGYTKDKTLCAGIDQDGALWAGTFQKGLFRFKINYEEEMENKGNIFTLNNLFFKDDSYELIYDTKMELNKLVGYLKQNPDYTIEIKGYTNGLPSNEYCVWLSTWRARKVYEYLSAYGINKARMTFEGSGKSSPIATDEPQERNMNQRVEIQVKQTE